MKCEVKQELRLISLSSCFLQTHLVATFVKIKIMSSQERKQKEKEHRYNTILEAAEKIMQADGLYSLNMDLVAKETELAKGTLYLYFKSKEDIVAALSIKARTLLLNYFEKATKKSGDSIEQLNATASATFDFYKKYPFYFELIAIYEVNHKLEDSAGIQLSINKLFNFVNEISKKAKEEGKLHPSIDPIQFTYCQWGMLIGMTQLIKVRGAGMKQGQGFTTKDLTNTFMGLIERGMKS